MSQKFEAAAKGALCNFLSVTGSAAASYAAYGLFTPGPFDEWGALGYAAVAGLAYSHGCTWDSGAAGPVGGIDGCSQITGGYGVIQTGKDGAFSDLGTSPDMLDAVSITKVEVFYGNQSGKWVSYVEWTRVGGGSSSHTAPVFRTEEEAASWKYRLRPVTGTCGSDETPTTPPVGPHTHVDPDDGCEINVSFQGFMATPEGNAGAVWKMEPKAQARASGGVIGGCNFEPIIYYQPPGGGGGGGGPVAPWIPGPPGDGGEPWWAPVVRGAVGGVVGAIGNKILDKLFEEKVPGVTYRVVSVCEKDADGEPVSLSREVTIPPMPLLSGLVARVDAMDDLMQGLKDFKQPICPPERVKPAGNPVTINFESVDPDIARRDRVRKHLSYRDQSGRDEEFHRQHWAGFSWQTGGAIVTSKGLPWGVVQVWAASNEEGQRVIAHAADAAGVNISSPKHVWEFSTTNHPRYGRRATVRPVVWDESGTLMASKRPGPDGIPGWKRNP